MKKLIIALLLCLTLAALPTLVFAAPDGATIDGATAAYASLKPVIDGEIDDIWQYTPKFYGDQCSDDNAIAGSYAQLLWDESGLYLLAFVKDSTITENDASARNSVDFWVSEKNTKTDSYSSNPGDWHFCKASDGTEAYYTGNENVYSVASKAVKVNSDNYVVELYVPFQSDIKPEIGSKIGFTVSFNDDNNGDGERDTYSYWAVTADSDAYWEKTLALPDVTFAGDPLPDKPAETAAETVIAPAESAEAPAAAESAPQTSDAAIGLAIVSLLSIASIAVLRKNK